MSISVMSLRRRTIAVLLTLPGILIFGVVAAGWKRCTDFDVREAG